MTKLQRGFLSLAISMSTFLIVSLIVIPDNRVFPTILLALFWVGLMGFMHSE